jgi:glutathione S-transferase
VIRVHRVPYSTNVDRVALAAGLKGLEVEWVDHPWEDRSAIRALSGQDLAPVAEIDGDVVVDSMVIVERLEQVAPEPRLYPADPAGRARVDVFVEWFNGVWKGPPNRIADELERESPDRDAIAAWAAQLGAWRDTFEGLLTVRDHLLGDELTAADVCAFPFLRYGDPARREPDDTHPFHLALEEHTAWSDAHPLVRAWLDRVDALPRA